MATSPEDMQAVKRLLAEVIDSFEKLEIVVHVHKSGFQPAVDTELAKATSVSVDEVRKCVEVLGEEGVLDPAGPWRTSVDALARMYEDDRIEVFNLMTRTALERVRKEAARVFADAFLLRPKKKGDPGA